MHPVAKTKNERPRPRRLSVAILLFFAYLLPCGAINPFAAMDMGPDPFPTEADAGWYIAKVLAGSLGLIALAHVVGLRPTKRRSPGLHEPEREARVDSDTAS